MRKFIYDIVKWAGLLILSFGVIYPIPMLIYSFFTQNMIGWGLFIVVIYIPSLLYFATTAFFEAFEDNSWKDI